MLTFASVIIIHICVKYGNIPPQYFFQLKNLNVLTGGSEINLLPSHFAVLIISCHSVSKTGKAIWQTACSAKKY